MNLNFEAELIWQAKNSTPEHMLAIIRRYIQVTYFQFVKAVHSTVSRINTVTLAAAAALELLLAWKQFDL